MKEKLYSYIAYGLGIQSPLSLPELLSAKTTADVCINLGTWPATLSATNNGTNLFTTQTEVGRIWVHAGRQIIINPLPGAEEARIRSFILGPLMAILLRQQGLLVLHASCIATNAGGAVAFVGAAGWGKSTLALALHARGCRFVSDDILAIRVEQGSPIVLPSAPHSKLWPETAVSLGYLVDDLPKLHAQTEKRVLCSIRGFSPDPLPLKRVYVLSEGERYEIEPLQPQQALVELVRHTRAMNLLSTKDYLNSHFLQATYLIKRVPIFRLTRPNSLAQLPELVNLVEDDLTYAARSTHKTES